MKESSRWVGEDEGWTTSGDRLLSDLVNQEINLGNGVLYLNPETILLVSSLTYNPSVDRKDRSRTYSFRVLRDRERETPVYFSILYGGFWTVTTTWSTPEDVLSPRWEGTRLFQLGQRVPECPSV